MQRGLMHTGMSWLDGIVMMTSCSFHHTVVAPYHTIHLLLQVIQQWPLFQLAALSPAVTNKHSRRAHHLGVWL